MNSQVTTSDTFERLPPHLEAGRRGCWRIEVESRVVVELPCSEKGWVNAAATPPPFSSTGTSPVHLVAAGLHGLARPSMDSDGEIHWALFPDDEERGLLTIVDPSHYMPGPWPAPEPDDPNYEDWGAVSGHWPPPAESSLTSGTRVYLLACGEEIALGHRTSEGVWEIRGELAGAPHHAYLLPPVPSVDGTRRPLRAIVHHLGQARPLASRSDAVPAGTLPVHFDIGRSEILMHVHWGTDRFVRTVQVPIYQGPHTEMSVVYGQADEIAGRLWHERYHCDMPDDVEAVWAETTGASAVKHEGGRALSESEAGVLARAYEGGDITLELFWLVVEGLGWQLGVRPAADDPGWAIIDGLEANGVGCRELIEWLVDPPPPTGEAPW